MALTLFLPVQLFWGAFAFLGHSIGALMAIKVAKRARAELGVEPVLVVMLERGAAQHPLFTDSGAQWLRDDPVTFFEVWNPTIFKLYKSAGGWKVHIFFSMYDVLWCFMYIYKYVCVCVCVCIIQTHIFHHLSGCWASWVERSDGRGIRGRKTVSS